MDDIPKLPTDVADHLPARHGQQMPALPTIANHRLGVFSLDEALKFDWTPDKLRTAVRRGRLERLRPGVFAVPHAGTDTTFEAARWRLSTAAIAAVLANPTAAVSHTAAAVWFGLPVWYLPELPCLSVPPNFVGDIERTHLHRARTPSSHVCSLRAVRATSVARSVVDIGREHGALSALVVADAVLHGGKSDLPTLRRALLDCGGWPGVRAAREAISLADGLAESPLESASRYTLRTRVPSPLLQRSVFDLDGHFLGRVDFCWERFGVVGEADGMVKYDDEEGSSLREEKIRQERLERAGLIVVRWGRADLADPDQLVARLIAAFARGERDHGPRRWITRSPAASTGPTRPALHL